MVCRMVPALDPAGRANPEVQDRSKVPTDAKAEPTKMGMSGLSITTNETQAAAIGGRAMKTAHSGLDKLAMGNSGRGAFQPSWPQFGWLRAYSRRRASSVGRTVCDFAKDMECRCIFKILLRTRWNLIRSQNSCYQFNKNASSVFATL